MQFLLPFLDLLHYFLDKLFIFLGPSANHPACTADEVRRRIVRYIQFASVFRSCIMTQGIGKIPIVIKFLFSIKDTRSADIEEWNAQMLGDIHPIFHGDGVREV